MLTDLGYVLLQGGDGKAALKALESTPDIELLLTDIVLKGALSGAQIAEEAAIRRPGLKVLFAASQAIITRLGDHKPGDITTIEKPYPDELLARRIAETIGFSGPTWRQVTHDPHSPLNLPHPPFRDRRQAR